MIARIWRGITKESDKDRYFDYLNKTGVPDYRSTEGNRGVWVLRRVHRETAEFTSSRCGIRTTPCEPSPGRSTKRPSTIPRMRNFSSNSILTSRTTKF